MKEKLSHTAAGFKLLKKKIALILLLIVGLASATIIVVNYYTIRILSGARAYVNGESQYSKAQKDASLHLTNYIYSQNEADYLAFQKDIGVNMGDRMARLTLISKNINIEIAKKGFLQGENHPEDIDNMIWLFANFQHLAMFEKAIGIWTDGDAMVIELNQLGLQAHQKIISGKITSAEKRSLILGIGDLTARLTIKEKAFSDTLGNINRKINAYVFIVNVLITLVILGSSLSYAAIMIKNLAKSRKKIMEQNDSLQVINAGLDKFVYNVTHDLRSPLASLSGLLELIEDETDPELIKAYTMKMKESLERQDKFINEMLAFIKSKHTGVMRQECSLADIVDSVIAQNSHGNGGREIKFYKEIELANIESDALKLQVIINNLVSNSIKYSDSKKPERWVKVRTYHKASESVIEVADNGLGIRQKDQDRIFDKFYMSGDNKRSSGIGLYLVKDAVTQLNGRIEVTSEPGESSTFIISIPN